MLIVIINVIVGGGEKGFVKSNENKIHPYNIFGQSVTHNIPNSQKELDLRKDNNEIWEQVTPLSNLQLDGATILNPLTDDNSKVEMTMDSGHQENITTKLLWNKDFMYVSIRIRDPGEEKFSSCPQPYRTENERKKALQFIQSASFIRIAFDKVWTHKTIHLITHNINACTLSEKIVFERQKNHMQPLLNVDIQDSFVREKDKKVWQVTLKIPMDGDTINKDTNWRFNIEFVHVNEKMKTYSFYRWVPMHTEDRPYWYGIIKFNDDFRNEKVTLSASEKFIIKIEQLLFSIYEAQQLYHKNQNTYAKSFDELEYKLGKDVERDNIQLSKIEGDKDYFSASLQYNDYLYIIHEYQAIEIEQVNKPTPQFWVFIVIGCAVMVVFSVLAILFYQSLSSFLKKLRLKEKEQESLLFAQ